MSFERRHTFYLDPSVASKKKKSCCRTIASNKMQPMLNVARVVFKWNKEKVWGKSAFAWASLFWIWVQIPFLLKEVTRKGGLHYFFPHTRSCSRYGICLPLLSKCLKRQLDLQSSLSQKSFSRLLQHWWEELTYWVSAVASETAHWRCQGWAKGMLITHLTFKSWPQLLRSQWTHINTSLIQFQLNVLLKMYVTQKFKSKTKLQLWE